MYICCTYLDMNTYIYTHNTKACRASPLEPFQLITAHFPSGLFLGATVNGIRLITSSEKTIAHPDYFSGSLGDCEMGSGLSLQAIKPSSEGLPHANNWAKSIPDDGLASWRHNPDLINSRPEK